MSGMHEGYGGGDKATVGYQLTEIEKLKAENERLLAALKKIADDPGGFPPEDVVDDLQDIAKSALKVRT